MIASFIRWWHTLLFRPYLWLEFVNKDTVIQTERFVAGVPLTVSGKHLIKPFRAANIPTGIKVTLGPWHWALIAPHHPIMFRHKLLVMSEVVSPNNCNEIHVPVWNMSDDAIMLDHGTKIGRLIPMRRAICRIRPIISVHDIQEQMGLTN